MKKIIKFLYWIFMSFMFLVLYQRQKNIDNVKYNFYKKMEK